MQSTLKDNVAEMLEALDTAEKSGNPYDAAEALTWMAQVVKAISTEAVELYVKHDGMRARAEGYFGNQLKVAADGGRQAGFSMMSASYELMGEEDREPDHMW